MVGRLHWRPPKGIEVPTRLQTGHARTDGRAIVLMRLTTDDIPHIYRFRNRWLPDDIPWAEVHKILLDKGTPPWGTLEPQEFCWAVTGSGDNCLTKIKTENQRSKLWACGRHMRAFQDEVARNRRYKEEDRRRAVLEEVLQRDLEEVLRAHSRLMELGYSHLLPQDRWRAGQDRKLSMPEIRYGTLYHTETQIALVDLVKLLDPEWKEQDEEMNIDWEAEGYEAVEHDLFGS